MLTHFILIDRGGQKCLRTAMLGAPPSNNTTLILPSGQRSPRWAEYRIREVIMFDNGDAVSYFAMIIPSGKANADASRRMEALLELTEKAR